MGYIFGWFDCHLDAILLAVWLLMLFIATGITGEKQREELRRQTHSRISKRNVDYRDI